jgi:hypothetical protein
MGLLSKAPGCWKQQLTQHEMFQNMEMKYQLLISRSLVASHALSLLAANGVAERARCIPPHTLFI